MAVSQGTESVGMRTGWGRGVRGLWRYGTTVVEVWDYCPVAVAAQERGVT
ncbi:hypothetical protein V6Z11_A07G163000 [Gossypium hirsutum]